ncbi:hypothetical protein B0T26DRAFT_677597 [Lasiosphaeria miniovina]|uniref:Uncharacterized protein n=1 Tax=Lasiosphaeria miniovina TaxID=1954250 RepID=A0AA40ACF9_9PEZI|nr:uncharacterized protein B0T26DRAFT_677597 [Lasiosphaeria miniovina]KAK0713237.1 hypothetical protein B0T26DRAFT_677597 [Lasiosphaeria miniovina]
MSQARSGLAGLPLPAATAGLDNPSSNQQQSQPMCRQDRDSWSCGCSTRWTLEPCPDYYTRWGCQRVIVKDHKSRCYCKRCSADLKYQRSKERHWHSGQYKYWKYDS